jgi:hypothetical protein
MTTITLRDFLSLVVGLPYLIPIILMYYLTKFFDKILDIKLLEKNKIK